MNLILELNPAEQALLMDAARREGLAPAELARKLVTDQLPLTGLRATSPQEQVQARLREWQDADDASLSPSLPTRDGLTPIAALFRQWEEEDTRMTEAEREAEEKLWDDFAEGINQTRVALGMRQL